jgi:hypothetical protein
LSRSRSIADFPDTLREKQAQIEAARLRMENWKEEMRTAIKAGQPLLPQPDPVSPWIKELEAINSVHSCYRPESWSNLNHYIFGFHDSTFECVAESFLVEARATTLAGLLTEICGKLIL